MLVPNELVIAQAQEISVITIKSIILAVIIAVMIGITITSGIQKSLKRVSKVHEQVTDGNLTGEVKVKSKDEFRDLAYSTTDMIYNNKNLVRKVTDATGQLENSAFAVKDVSNIINDYSMDITQAINEINQGMSKQSEHAQECVLKTDSLSNEMQEVSRVVEKVEKLVGETDEMINQGMGIIQVLGERALESNEITKKVGRSIEELKKESEIINDFVETITDISEQTNLLSLTA